MTVMRMLRVRRGRALESWRSGMIVIVEAWWGDIEDKEVQHTIRRER